MSAPPTLNEGRGRSPSDRPSRACWPRATCRRSLNEGRGRSPSDSGFQRRAQNRVEFRSTKAGAVAPATVLTREKQRSDGGFLTFMQSLEGYEQRTRGRFRSFGLTGGGLSLRSSADLLMYRGCAPPSPRITGGSQTAQNSQGSPSACACLRPTRRRASPIRPGNR